MANYNTLSRNIAKYPDGLAIFRRFLPLNVRNVLCLQAEIVHLSEILEIKIELDSTSPNPKRSQYQYNIAALKGPHDNPGDAEQWRQTLELRRLLQEYNAALLQLADLFRLAPVSKADLSCLREVLESPIASGKDFLKGFEALTWDDDNQRDLTSLMGRDADKDMLSKLIDKFVRTWYHKYIGHRLHDPMSICEAGGENPEKVQLRYYPDSYITGIIDALSTILSSVLPTISAFALFFINDPLTRMIAIVVCTLLFSTILTLVAKAKRAECFGATAAFAAVLVVFVGNSNGTVA